MKSRLLLSLALIAGSYPALGNDKFTCWATASTPPTASAASKFWTDKRRAEAIPRDISPPRSAQSLGAASPVNVATAPYQYGGKLYFVLGGVSYVGSAQFVRTKSKSKATDSDILITAAHNVLEKISDQKIDKATNVYFVRARNGKTEGEGYAVDLAAVPNEWIPLSTLPTTAAASGEDYAILHATQVYGGGNFLLSAKNDFTLATMIGYPAQSPYDGVHMYAEVTDKQAEIDGKYYMAIPYSLKPGASGGAWYLSPSGTSTDYPLVSLISALDSSGNILGPSIRQNTFDLRDYVEGGCK